MAEKRYAEAAASYEKGLANGKDSRLIVKHHQALLRSGDTKKADDKILRWLEQNPQDQISRAYLAESYMLRRLNQQAIAQYQILQSSVPNNPVILNNLAVLYQKEKDPRALAVAEKAYKLDPEKADYADTLGWILVEQGKSARGLELLEKATKLEPKNPEVRVHLAYALAQTGQTKRARQEIARAKEMKLSPEQERQVQQLLQPVP
jgi:Flp pilus assembly protein TadD